MKTTKEVGNKFELHLLDQVRDSVDVTSYRTAKSGGGIDKHDIRIPSLNIEIEAKNATGQFNLQGDWEQTKRQRTSGNIGVLAIRHPKKPEFHETLVVMDWNDWLYLLQEIQPKREVSFTARKEDVWKIKRLVEQAKQVIKLYENHA